MLAVMIKLMKEAVFVRIPINRDDSIDQSDDSLQNSELSTQLVVAKLTSIDMYQEVIIASRVN